MSRWKDKKDFISWVKAERFEAEKNQYIYFEHLKNNFKDCPTDIKMILKNSTLNTETLETVIDNEILEHINYYFSDIKVDIYNLDIFISTVDSVRFFKKSKLSTDGKVFNDEIKQIKKKADYLQFFSMTTLDIRLPILPQDAIFYMVSEFRRNELDPNIIEYFHNFFNDRKRLPKETKTYLTRLKNLKELEEKEKEKKIDFSYARAVEKINWYKPNKNLKYDYLNPLRTSSEMILYNEDGKLCLGSCEIEEQVEWINTDSKLTNPLKIIKKVSLVVKKEAIFKKLP